MNLAILLKIQSNYLNFQNKKLKKETVLPNVNKSLAYNNVKLPVNLMQSYCGIKSNEKLQGIYKPINVQKQEDLKRLILRLFK